MLSSISCGESTQVTVRPCRSLARSRNLATMNSAPSGLIGGFLRSSARRAFVSSSAFIVSLPLIVIDPTQGTRGTCPLAPCVFGASPGSVGDAAGAPLPCGAGLVLPLPADLVDARVEHDRVVLV